MLTLFAMPKPFCGHIGVIQRNAISSWNLLRPACQIILIGEDEGTFEMAQEIGALHVSRVARNEYETPLLSDLFEQARVRAASDLLCYVNADIILMSDFVAAVERVRLSRRRFLMAGQRWNLDLRESFDFTGAWEDRLRTQVDSAGELEPPSGIDYFVFDREFAADIPPFALGRTVWDNWLLYRARSLRIPLVDATSCVMAIHQMHDYTHVSPGTMHADVWEGPEAKRNQELAVSQDRWFTLNDATHVLTSRGLRRTRGRRYFRRKLETLPVLHPHLFFVEGWIRAARWIYRRLRSRR